MVAVRTCWGLTNRKWRPAGGAPLSPTTVNGSPNSCCANSPGLPMVALEAMNRGEAP